MTRADLLREGIAALAAHSDSARLDAELLLMDVLGCMRAQLITRADEAVGEPEGEAFRQLIRRRAAGEPVAYLLGTQEFWSLPLRVTPDVLVPRPETELLVEWALERLTPGVPSRVLDLGTGSGAIALALARERGQARIVASDVSPAALAVAQGNAERLRLAVEFRCGHWWAVCAADERFDLVVSNPPYIARDDRHLAALRHEPRGALSDGGDGLQALRAIIAGAPAHLRAGGWLLVEHGYDQGAAVRALFAAAGFANVATRRDLEGRERVSGGQWA